MPQRIAFIRKSRWPAANQSTVQALRFAFPQAEITELTLVDLIRQRRGLMLLNTFLIARQYGGDIVLGRRSVRESFWITSLMFYALRQLVQAHVKQLQPDCSFQMQSLFDASTPLIPHYVYTDHTLWANKYYPGFRRQELYNKAWMQLEPQIYTNAELIFTRSNNISQSLIEDYSCDPRKIKCVHVGSNVPLMPPTKHRTNKLHVLFVGIDWERKGGPELVQAWQTIQAHFPTAWLHIIGCRPKLELAQCTIHGRLPLGVVSTLYSQADIFCLPTWREPFGVAVLEAMAHHLPVITTRIGALQELVVHGETGWLIEPGGIAELAWRMEQLLDNAAQRARFGSAGAARVQQIYNWHYVGKQFARYMLK